MFNNNKNRIVVGQIAWMSVFMFVVFPIDINDNRRHVHVFYRGKRDQECAAKFWIEANGEKCIEIAYSKLSAKENEAIMKALDKNWDFINEQIDKTFLGIKTESKRIK